MGNEVSSEAKSDEENQAEGSQALSTSIDGSTHDGFVFSTPNETPSASAQPSPAGSARASPVNLRDEPDGTGNHRLRADENEGSSKENFLDTSLRLKSEAASEDDVLSVVLLPPEIQRHVTVADDSKNTVDCPPQSPLQKIVDRVTGEQSSPLPTRVPTVRETSLRAESSNDTLERLPQSPFYLFDGLNEMQTSPLNTCLPTVQEKDLPAKDPNDTENIPPQSPLHILDRVTGEQRSPLHISVPTVREEDLRAEDSNDTIERPPRSPLHIIFDHDAGDQLSDLQKDPLIRPPQSALQTTYDRDAQSSSLYTSVPTVPEDDHAWMDPVLAAAAAGAASKKSRQKVQRFDLDRMIQMPFGFDDDLRESFQRLASTTRDTASTFAHMAVPAWIETADTVKKSAKEIGESFHTRNDDTEKGQVTVGNDKQGTEHVKEAPKQGINQFVDNDWRESLKRLASTAQSAAATFAHLAVPALSEAADVVKKSVIEVGESKTEPKENIDVQPKPSSANDVWETSLEQLTSTTQSAADKLMWCCDDDALKISASEVAESAEIEISIRPDDDSQSAMLDREREVLTIDTMADKHNEATTAANAHREQEADHLFEQDGAQPAVMDCKIEAMTQNTVFDDELNRPETERNAHSEQGANHVTDDDWMESLERLASFTKSATAEFANIAAPFLIEAADMVKESVAQDARHVEKEMESMEVKSTDEWQESLQRLASSVKSTATSFISIASPIVTENANILIKSAKEAAEEYKVSRQERNHFQEANGPTETSQTVLPIVAGEPNQTADNRNGGENGDDIDLSHSKNEETIGAKLDISNDETVIASSGWHDKNTSLRKHGSAPTNCSASAIDTNVDPTITTDGESPDSSLSPRPLATTKLIPSQTPPSSLENMRKHDQDECVSVASLSITSSQSVGSSQHRLNSEKTKSLLSSYGNFMEMVSKRLASDSSRYPPTHRGGRNASQRTSRGPCRTGNITPSPGITPNRFSFSLEQDSFEEMQPASPPDSLQQSGSLLVNTPPRLQPPEEVTLWDMFPANDSDAIAQGGKRSTVLVEPQPRVLLENASDQSKVDIRSGSTYSSEDHQSLPMSTGFIGKRKTPDAYSNDTASDPGTTLFKRRRKSRRPLQVKLRSSRSSDITPLPLSPESSFLGESLNMDIRPMHDELSPERQRDSALFYFDTLEGDEDANVAGLPGRQDKMLHEALLAFSSLNDVDFLSEISPQKIPESLLWLASVRWRQLIANWEHDEMMKAISARPCSLHCVDESNQRDEHVHDWTGDTWTTSVFNSKRDERLTLRDEFRSSRRTSPSMTNHSGFRPLVCEGELQCLTSFVAGIGPPRDGHNQTVLRHTLASRKDTALEDLLQSANTKLALYSGVVKGIATYATINLDPANTKTAVHHSVDVKAAVAVTQKADRKYEGDILQVKDILRGQIILPDDGSLVCALSSLNAMCAGEGPGTSEEHTNECIPEIKIVRVKNLFQFRPAKTPLNDNLPTGYRHVLITIRFSDGFLAELQLQLSQMFQILGVRGYELHRQITQMDVACTYTEAPDFEQCAHGRSLKNILRRMFRRKSLIPNSVAESKFVPEHIRSSPENLGLSTTTNDRLPIDSKRESALIGGNSMEPAAEASKEMSGPPPSLAGGGIAAMAALAARNRNKASEKESVTVGGDDSTAAGANVSNEMSGPPHFLAGGGIASMAALAARNCKKASEVGSAAVGGDDSTAAVADASDEVRGPPPFLKGGGIAAMAALAARNRIKASEEESAAIGGDDRKEHGAYASNEVSGPQPSLAGGGIAAMAALVARNRSKASEGKSASKEGDDNWEAGFDENDAAGEHAPLSGYGLACEAALAARRRNKASEGEPTAMVRDDSTAAGADASDEASQRPRFGVGEGKPAQHRNDASEIESAAKGEEGEMEPDAGASHAAPSCGCEDITTAYWIRDKSSEEESAKNIDVGNDPASQPPVHGVLPLDIPKHSAEDVLHLLILEALKDASCSSRRISTLCCASWLFYGVAFGTRKPIASDQNSHNSGGVHKFPSILTCDVKPAELTAITGGSGAAVDNAKENEMVSDGGDMAAYSPCHEGEKKATTEDEKQQSLFEGGDGGVLAVAAAFVRSRVTKNSDNEKEKGVINGAAAAVTHQQNEKQDETSPDNSDSQERAHDISTKIGSNINGVIRGDDRYVVLRPESSEILPPIDPSTLVRVGDRALLRALTIANQAVSHGIIGWLEYGSSNFRTAGRPLDILGKLAYHHAMRKDWHASINVLRALVLQCEHHLPLYHPLTLSSMLDLAAALTKASEHKTARHVLGQATDRLAFYLAEQEGAYVEFRDELQSSSKQNVTFQELTGANYVSMLRAFISLFEELIDRDYLQLFESDNDITLINYCLLGDSLSVLANCLKLSETAMDARKDLSASLTSNAYWSAACQHYRLALKGWTRKGCGLTHPNMSAVACAIARCLREVGKVDRSIQILSSVVGATSRVSSSYPEAPQKLGERSKYPSDDSLPVISFLPSRAGSFSSHMRARSNVAIEQSTALNLWYMAAYAVESSQDERGRIRALSLLHASSQALQRALIESKAGDHAACLEEMLQCVEAEALELFKPLGAIKEENHRERKVKVAAIKSAKNYPYKPTRTSMPTGQKTSTHAGTTTLSVDDKTPHDHDGRYPQRRFRPRPKTSSVHSALV